MISRPMQRAIDLARRGAGRVEPNPMVGAVVVRDGEIVAEGWHDAYGGPHAEVAALAAAGAAARGAELHVTLEPCATQGKTPPCTTAVIESGVRRVVIGTRDPSERNGGKGIESLRAAGIEVVVTDDDVAVTSLLARFRRHLDRQRPYVIAKWAMTLDGKIATRGGDARWISSAASRQRVHEERSRADGVMVGIGTVLADDPSLTCRYAGGRNPIRIVVDPGLSIPGDAELARTADTVRTIVFFDAERSSGASSSAGRQEGGRIPIDGLRGAGVELEAISGTETTFIAGVLQRLRRLGIERLYVEGGEGLFTGLFEAAAIDQIQAFVAPKLVGGRTAKRPLAGGGIERMADAVMLCDPVVEPIGGDVLVCGFIDWPSEGESG